MKQGAQTRLQTHFLTIKMHYSYPHHIVNMSKRTRVKHGSGRTMYLIRDKKGRFKKWTNIGKSINRDKRTRAKRVKPGYGHRGDLR